MILINVIYEKQLYAVNPVAKQHRDASTLFTAPRELAGFDNNELKQLYFVPVWILTKNKGKSGARCLL